MAKCSVAGRETQGCDGDRSIRNRTLTGRTLVLVGLLAALSGVGCGDGPPLEECAAGTYEHDGDPETACVAWTVCPAGEYVSAAGTEDADQECAACAVGEYTTTLNAASCTVWTACVAGEYVSTAGSVSADQACTTCPTGTYTSGPNQSMCVALTGCAPGTVQTAPATMTVPAVCAACSAGQYCAGGEVAAVACGDGTWDHDGDPATSCAARTDCAAGQSVVSDGNATTDRSCAACAEDTYSSATNQATCTPWQVCGTGYVEGQAGSPTTDRTCVPEEWMRQFGTAGYDLGNSVSVDSDASVLVAGSTPGTLPGQSSAGGADAFLRKYDAAGAEVWTRQFGTASLDIAVSVSVGSDSSVLVAGYTDGTLPGESSAGGDDAFLRKYDAAGAVVWTRQFGSASTDWALSVSVGSDGSVLVAGYTEGTLPGQSSTGNWDAFLRKYDAAGNVLWTRQFGTAGYDSARSVSVGSDGSVLVAGDAIIGTFPGQSSAGGRDAFVRYDAAGAVAWTRQFGTALYDGATEVSLGTDGSVLLVGSTDGTLPGQSSAGGYDAFSRKYDAAGNVLWTRQFGSASNDEARSVSVGSDGSVLVAGYTEGTLPGQTSAGSNDAFVMKLAAP